MIKQINNNTKPRILGENIIINKDIVSYLYIIPSFRYENRNLEDINNHLEKLYTTINILNNKTPGLRFCLSTIDVPISSIEIKKSLLKNVSRWMETPTIKFPERITSGCYSLFLMEIFYTISSNAKEMTIRESIQDAFSTIKRAIGALPDLNKIFETEKTYNNILKNFQCERANQYITFRYLLSNYFPGNYFVNCGLENMKYNSVLTSIFQEYEFSIEKFKTFNNYIRLFGIEPEVKHCSVLQYTDFPMITNKLTLSLMSNGMKIFVKISDQSDLIKKLSRQRADLGFTIENADTDVSSEIGDIKLYSAVINRLKDGVLGCECSIVQLVSAPTEKELNLQVSDIITLNAQHDIIVRPFLNQQKAYFEYCIDRNIPADNYDQMCDLKYALAFKIDNFSTIGDFDSKDKIGLIKIGEEISSSKSNIKE